MTLIFSEKKQLADVPKLSGNEKNSFRDIPEDSGSRARGWCPWAAGSQSMSVGKILVKVRKKPGPAHFGELGLDPPPVLSL